MDTKTMKTHLTEDDLVLHYYGEMGSAEESAAAAHLSACATCHDSFRRLQRVLAAVDENVLSGPELPEHFERTVWARLEPNLRRDRGGWRSWLVLTPVRLAGAAAVLVLLIGAAFMAGRLTPRTDTPVGSTQAAATPKENVREGILLADLSDHLDRSQMVLVELATADDKGQVDISGERDRAEQLVAANRLYRQTALSTGDAAIADLLDELERVLVDVAASPEHLSSQDLEEVRRRIESKGLLFKVRVLSSEVHKRQRSIIQERAAQRSAL
jgi:hypothetical protein